MSEKRTVLVEFQDHSRLLSLSEESDEVESLTRAVKETFDLALQCRQRMLFQGLVYFG